MESKSIRLEEKELRKIARSVIIKNYLRLLKEEEEKETPKEEKKEEKSEKEKILDPLALSQAAATSKGRLGADDAVDALAITGGMLYAGSGLLGYASTAAILGSNPLGWTILGTAAVAAGAYYLFGAANKDINETVAAAMDKNLYVNTKKFFEGLGEQLNKAGQPEEAKKMTQTVDSLLSISDEAARKYAEDFYQATQGGLTGIGTNLKKIGRIFKELLDKGYTHMDISFIAEKHEAYVKSGLFGGATADADMYAAADDDMSAYEISKYIGDYIKTMPLIKIGSESYTVEQWKRWIKNGAQ